MLNYILENKLTDFFDKIVIFTFIRLVRKEHLLESLRS